MRRLVGLVVVVVLAACGGGTQSSAYPLPASPFAGPQSLYVADVDGPPVDLLIGRTLVASVPCAGYLRLTEGIGPVPPLPWSLDVRRQGGDVLQHFDVTTGDGFTLLIRSDAITLGQLVSTGLSAAPDACARWSAPPSATATRDLHVDNGTTKPITLVVDGVVAATVPAGLSETVALDALPAGTWSVESRLPGGKAIAQAQIDKARAGLLGFGLRTDLSCGRLDLWIAVPMLGPAPGPGTPGDCDG